MPRSKSDPCSECGKLCWTSKKKGYTPKTAHRCRDCARSAPIMHGMSGYKRGCRCQDCRDGNAAAMREYAAMVKARDGISLAAKYGTSRDCFINAASRAAIYERDGWVCQICMAPVPRNLDPNHRLAPSLDHIEPQSLALIPDHSPANLRLAHRGCNSARGNRAGMELKHVA